MVADEGQLYRSESRPGQSGARDDGQDQGKLSAAHRAGQGSDQRQAARRADGAETGLNDTGKRMKLAERIQQLFDNPPGEFTDEHFALFDEFKQRLNAGEVRAAEK